MRILCGALALVLSGTLTFVATSPASAQGLRAELHTGYDRVQGGGDRRDGLLYGVGLGYDVTLAPKLMVGIDASIDDSTTKGCESAANVRACVRAGRDLAIGGRVGYAISATDTVYVLASYTNARVTSRVTTTAATPAPTPTPTPVPALAAAAVSSTQRYSDNLDGVRFGLGLEHNFAANLYGKAEYRYSNYEAGVERHQILAGVGIRF
jgi:outer membrane immunogenic protein